MGKWRDRRNAKKAAKLKRKNDKKAAKQARKDAKMQAKTAKAQAKFDLKAQKSANRAMKAESRNKALGNVGSKLVEVGGGIGAQLLGRNSAQNRNQQQGGESSGGFMAWLKSLFSKK